MLNCYQNTTSYVNIILRILYCICCSKNTVALCVVTVTVLLEERFELSKLIPNFTKYADVPETARRARTHTRAHTLPPPPLNMSVRTEHLHYLHTLNFKMPRVLAYQNILTWNKYVYFCTFLECVTFRQESSLKTQHLFYNPQSSAP